MSSANPSPLRYPGGKYKISKLIGLLIGKTGRECRTYVEPFAGGAGVALDLLMNGVVDRVAINDSDRAIYSTWRALIEHNEAFIDKMLSTEVTIDEWKRQREIYFRSKKFSFEYGFATFYLNRTNHSGMLLSGPIGGMKQGDWKLDARFNKKLLANKIRAIGELSDRITVYGRDVFSFMRNQLPKVGKNAFVYFDPPYYRKGKVLYKNFFSERMHRELAAKIISDVDAPWVVSYDATPEIKEIYRELPSCEFSLNYSLANNGSGQEIMFFKDQSLIPTNDEIRSVGMMRQFYGRSGDNSSRRSAGKGS